MPRRNDPCFCGSGKKYKKCHLLIEESAARPSPVHDLDRKVSEAILKFGASRFGKSFERLITELPGALPFEEIEAFAVPFLLYEAGIGGRPLAAVFLEERASRLPERDRRWVERQLASWLTIWEITAVDPGRSLSLLDRLTGQRREVIEVSASRSLTPLDHILARVTDFEDASVLCGMYPRSLPRHAVEEVIAAAPQVESIEELRNYENASLLVRRWEQAANRLDMKRRMPPELRNNDGDPFVQVIDHFRFAASQRGDLEAAIAKLPIITPPQPGEAASQLHVIRPKDKIILGTLTIDGGSLRAESNSLRRADDLRKRLERSAGNILQHRGREVTDPLRDFGKAVTSKREQMIEYPGLDESIPALGGKTPRQALEIDPNQRPARRRGSNTKRTKTRRILDEIFHGQGDRDLDELLQQADPTQARDYLLEKLRDDYHLADGFTAQMIVEKIGIGADLPRFAELVLDRSAPLGARAAAFDIILGEDESLADGLIEQLPPGEEERLAEEPLREMLKSILVDADYASMVVTLFAEAVSDDAWETPFQRLESLRREIGLSASACYEWLLRAPWLPLRMRNRILDAMKEAHVRTTTSSEVAVLEPIDFRGDFKATLVSEMAGGEYLIAQLETDPGGAAIGTAAFAPRDPLADLEPEDLVARTSAGVAASLVSHALRNRKRDDEHDGQTEAAIRIFQRIAPEPVPSPEPADAIDPDRLAALLARKEYEVWFFLDEELNSAKILIPTIEAGRDWYKRAIPKLNRPKIRKRLRAQTEYMSRWHFLRGEHEEAAILSRLSRDLEKGFERSPLVRALLEKVIRLHEPISRGEMRETSDGIVRAVESGASRAEDMMPVLRKIVANQMKYSAPPQVRETFDRLQRQGISKSAARDMICTALHADLMEVLESGRSYDEDAYAAKLKKLR